MHGNMSHILGKSFQSFAIFNGLDMLGISESIFPIRTTLGAIQTLGSFYEIFVSRFSELLKKICFVCFPDFANQAGHAFPGSHKIYFKAN